MKKTLPSLKSSELYRKIAELPLSASARAEALAALNIAERLASFFGRTNGTPAAKARLGTPKTA